MSFPFGADHFVAEGGPIDPTFAAYLGKVALAGKEVPHRPLLHIDYETYSEVDLRKTGASVYARDPSTEVLMLAYGWSTGEIKQWVPASGEPMPRDLLDALHDPSVTLAAWNAPFEMAITEHCLGIKIPRERWLDVMALSYSLSLPGKLSTCGTVIGLPEDKKKLSRGTALITKFCKPRKPTKHLLHTRATVETDPEAWVEFLEYNRQDVEAERAIYRRIKKFQMPDHEWSLWHLDQKINDAGIPINLKAVRAAVHLSNRTIQHDLAEMKDLTGLANPNSNVQILPWLRAHGYQFLDLKKGHVERAAKTAEDQYDAVQAQADSMPGPLGEYFADRYLETLGLLGRVLELRLRVSKASVKKFPALLAATDEDGNLRGCHQFAGAGRTWRWSGRRFQPQNLSKPSKAMEKELLAAVPTHDENGDKRGSTERAIQAFGILVDDIENMSVEAIWAKYSNPMEALVAAVRPMVQAPEGHLLIDADLSAIENVVLGWLAKDDKILRVFREGLDPYIDFAVDMFHKPYDEIKAIVDSGDSTMRTTAKPGVLGCLRGDTPVLTDNGWKQIVELRSDDLLWDGVEWVAHGGVVFKGRQPILRTQGLHATPDHKFLVNNEWREMCQLVSQPKTFASALATVNGAFSNLSDPAAARERYFGVAANAGWNGNYLAATSYEVCPANAPDALLRTVAATPESGSAKTFSTFSQTVSTLRGRAAKTRKTLSTSITARGEFLCTSRTQRNGWPISLTTWMQMGDSKSTEPTTMTTTGSVTCDWRPEASKIGTSETWDILNAGPRSRFVVMTDAGPVVAHNCGYMLSAGEERENKQTGEIEATGLLGYAWNMKVPLTKEMAALSVQTFRSKFEKVVQFWWDMDKAVRRAITTGQPQTVGYLQIDMKKPFMRIKLPSGRNLHYLRPKLIERMMPWGKKKLQITYENMENGRWVRTSSHPGKLAENVTQAVARDILAHGMVLADKAGIDIRMHVHDQIVGVAPIQQAKALLAILIRCMTTLPGWADDKLPLKAAGLTTPIFIKD